MADTKSTSAGGTTPNPAKGVQTTPIPTKLVHDGKSLDIKGISKGGSK